MYFLIEPYVWDQIEKPEQYGYEYMAVDNIESKQLEAS